jgi:hypothetical protein
MSTVINCEVHARGGWLPGGAVTVTWEPGTDGGPDGYTLEVGDGDRSRVKTRLDPEHALELALALAPQLSDLLRQRERETFDRMQRDLTHGQDDHQ